MADWFTVDPDPDGAGEATDRLLAAWAEAPVMNLETCRLILDTAREQVIEYAAALDVVDGEPVIPDRLTLAQLRQAENLWNAGRVSGAGDMGVDTFTFTPRPLDKTIRQIIRPVSSFSYVL